MKELSVSVVDNSIPSLFARARAEHGFSPFLWFWQFGEGQPILEVSAANIFPVSRFGLAVRG